MYSSSFNIGSGVPPSLPALAIAGTGIHGSWSSLVGIITAIVGNILISFALNTQRYAHVRIDREYNDGLGKNKPPQQPSKSFRGYGATAQQDQVAEERERLNAEASGPGNPDNDGRDAFGRPEQRKKPFSSDETAKPHEKNGSAQGNRKSYLRSPVWWLGIILMAVGETGNFLAYGFAPASIVSPLGVVALISNCLIAPLMLKERFRKRDFWGVLIAIGGAVTVVLSAKTSETKMGPDDLWHAIKRWEFLTYIGITCALIVALMVISPRYGKSTILIDLGLVGLFGGYTALSTKGVASMLSGSLWKALTFPITYGLIAVLIISAILQIRYINRALSNFNSTQVIPTQFVLFTLSVIIGSAVLYRDFEKTDLDHVVKFVVGCALTFSGVWLITSGRRNNERDNDETQEEAIRLIDEEIEEEEDERTPLKHEHRQSDTSLDRSSDTQKQSAGDTATAQSGGPAPIPSVAIATYDDQNVKVSSAEHHDTLARPRTPPNPREFIETDATPFFTPGSAPSAAAQGRLSIIGRTDSSPADPLTPTRASRAPSPPKPDISALAPGEAYQTPPPGLFRSARGSISRLLPGPFFGPLSSGSLSTVVAESLLNGEGSPQGPIRRRSYRKTRPYLTLRTERNRRRSATALFSADGTDLESVLITPSLSRWQTHESVVANSTQGITDEQEGNEGSAVASSSRGGGFLPSLSPTFSKLMSRMKDRGKGLDGDDPEAGPSNRNQSEGGETSDTGSGKNAPSDQPQHKTARRGTIRHITT